MSVFHFILPPCYAIRSPTTRVIRFYLLVSHVWQRSKIFGFLNLSFRNVRCIDFFEKWRQNDSTLTRTTTHIDGSIQRPIILKMMKKLSLKCKALLCQYSFLYKYIIFRPLMGNQLFKMKSSFLQACRNHLHHRDI